MASFLPSEIARLVLGYLEEHQYFSTYDEFLNSCPLLQECRGVQFRCNLMGYSLEDILREYCLIQNYVTCLRSTNLKENVSFCRNLPEKIKLLVNVIMHGQFSNTSSKPHEDNHVRIRTKYVDSFEQSSKLSQGTTHNHAYSSERVVEATKLHDLPGTRGFWQVEKKNVQKPNSLSTSLPNILAKDKDNVHKTPTSRDPRLKKDRLSTDLSDVSYFNRRDSSIPGLQTPNRPSAISTAILSSLSKSFDVLPSDLNVSVKTSDLLNYSDMHHEKIGEIDNILETSGLQVLNNKGLDLEEPNVGKDLSLYTNTSLGNTPEDLKNDFKELFATTITRSQSQLKVSRPGSSTPDKKYTSRVHEDSFSKSATKMRETPKKNLSPHNRFKRNIRSTSNNKLNKGPAVVHQGDFNSNLQGQVVNTAIKHDLASSNNVVILSNEKVCTDVTPDNKIIISKAAEPQTDNKNQNKQTNSNNLNHDLNTIVVETSSGLNTNLDTYIVAAKTQNVIYNDHESETLSDKSKSRAINVPLIPVDNQNYYNISAIQEGHSNEKYMMAGKYSDFSLTDGKFEIMNVGTSTPIGLDIAECRIFSEQQILSMPTLIMVQSNSNQFHLQDLSEHAEQGANELNHIYSNSPSQNDNVGDGMSITEMEPSQHTAPVQMLCSNLVAIPVSAISSNYCGAKLESQESIVKCMEKNDNPADSIFSIGTPEIKVNKDQSSSTPRRKSSHIRVLDFSTPTKSSLSPKKACTLPKMTSKNAHSPLPNKIHKNKKVHTKLFAPISEKSFCTDQTDKKSTAKKKTSVRNTSKVKSKNSKSTMPITEEIIIDSNLNQGTSWDAKLRTLVPTVVYNSKKYNTTNKIQNIPTPFQVPENVHYEAEHCEIDSESSSLIKMAKKILTPSRSIVDAHINEDFKTLNVRSSLIESETRILTPSQSFKNVPYEGNKSSLIKTAKDESTVISQSVRNVPFKGVDIKTTSSTKTMETIPSSELFTNAPFGEEAYETSLNKMPTTSTPSSQSNFNKHFEEENCKTPNRKTSIDTSRKISTPSFPSIKNVSYEGKDPKTLNLKTPTSIRTAKKTTTSSFQPLANESCKGIIDSKKSSVNRTKKKLSSPKLQSIANMSCKSKKQILNSKLSLNAKLKNKIATPRKSQRLEKKCKDNEKDVCIKSRVSSSISKLNKLNDIYQKNKSHNDSLESESLDDSLDHDGKLLEDALLQNDLERNEECNINERNLKFSIDNKVQNVEFISKDKKRIEDAKFVKKGKGETETYSEQSVCTRTSSASRSKGKIKKSSVASELQRKDSKKGINSNVNDSSHLLSKDNYVQSNSMNVSQLQPQENFNKIESNNLQVSMKPSYSEDTALVAPSKIIEHNKPKIENFEPPVPNIKITPDMPRGTCSNPLNVKCNLSALLVTPMKSAMMDVPLPTPKFVSPSHENEPISAIKILNIPTPNFLITPKHTFVTSTTKKMSPTSYTSRPTDYSSSSSYYKPDEGDDIFFNVLLDNHIVEKPEEVHFSNDLKVNYESEENNINVTHATRPVRQCTMKNKTKTTQNEDKGNLSEFSSSCTGCSSSSSDVSSDNASTSPSPPATKYIKAKKIEKTEKTLFKKENHPLSSLVNDTSLELEQKRLRVLSKLKGTNKIYKSLPTNIDCKIRNRNKKTIAKVTKNIEVKQAESTSNFRNRTLESSKTITRFKGKDNSFRTQDDANQSKSCEVTPSPMKSRRKSATPRKLETVKFYDEHVITSKVMCKQETRFSHARTEKIIPLSLIDASSLAKLTTVDYTQIIQVVKDSDNLSPPQISRTENKNNTSLISKISVDDYDINAIQEYISKSSTQLSISPIKINADKDSFDPVSAKQIEIELSDPGTNQLQGTVQKVVIDSEVSNSNNTDAKSDLSPTESKNQTESSDKWEHFEWSVSDCHEGSSNFFTHIDTSVTKKSISRVHLDESYLPSFSVYNTLKDVDEIRTMSITPLIVFFNNPKKKGKLLNTKRSNITEITSKQKETMQESKISLAHAAHDSPENIHKVDASEVARAVQSILPTAIDYFLDSQSNDIKLTANSDNFNIAVEGDIESQDSNDADLQNLSDKIIPSGSVSVAKRKRSSDENCQPDKKSKTIDPQSLLKGMNIDDLLSKIHGPE